MFCDPLGLEYNSLRNIVSSVEEALGTTATIYTYKDKTTVAFNKDGYNYKGTFYYDGTVDINGERKKIADNRNGTLYIDRNDFYSSMGIKNECKTSKPEEYTKKDAFIDSVCDNTVGATVSFFIGIIDTFGVSITTANTVSDFKAKANEKYKEKTVGKYYEESVVGEVYNEQTGKYESICTYTTYKYTYDINRVEICIFYASYTENFGVAYYTSAY